MKWISKTNVKTTLIALTALLCSCAPDLDSGNSTGDSKIAMNVIYGADGRLDLYQVTDDRLRTLADSTVALVKTSDLSVNGSTVFLNGHNFGQDMNLCPGEKYREQDTAAFCSGSLVGPDLILTAGHCIETQSSCDTTAFVFGFAVKSLGFLPKSVATTEVYRCKQIIKTVRMNSGADFAVIKLDRAVSGHAPLAVRGSGEPAVGDSLVVIGHPVGLPTKVATGGSVRSVALPEHFVANLDTYGGNSGSAVFNSGTGLIEGVLVRGEQDFESQGNCTISKVCAEGTCRGEDVTRISVVRPFLPGAVQPPPPPPSGEAMFSSAPNLVIPDNNKNGVASSLAVNQSPKGRKVFVDVTVTHTYIGDLVVKLVAADGRTVTLHNRAGGNAKNLIRTYEITSQLGSISATGAYKLLVQDLAAVDNGVLVSWKVRFN